MINHEEVHGGQLVGSAAPPPPSHKGKNSGYWTPGRRYDFIAYMRTDLWFATPPPSIETLSMRHISVPFCNPLPVAMVDKCARDGSDPLEQRLRSRSDAGYADGLGRGLASGCDVATDWMGVMPRHLAESYFTAHESLLATSPVCEKHRTRCHCHAAAINPECLLSAHLAHRRAPITRRSFGLIALARVVLPAPNIPTSGEYGGGDGVFTNVAIDESGINVLDCETRADHYTRCPAGCARHVFTGRLSPKAQPLGLVCFPRGPKPSKALPPKPPDARGGRGGRGGGRGGGGRGRGGGRGGGKRRGGGGGGAAVAEEGLSAAAAPIHTQLLLGTPTTNATAAPSPSPRHAPRQLPKSRDGSTRIRTPIKPNQMGLPQQVLRAQQMAAQAQLARRAAQHQSQIQTALNVARERQRARQRQPGQRAAHRAQG